MPLLEAVTEQWGKARLRRQRQVIAVAADVADGEGRGFPNNQAGALWQEKLAWSLPPVA